MMKRIGIWLCLLGVLGCSSGILYAAEDPQLAGVELQAMADTFQFALENNPTSQASDWVNPDTQRSGAVVPTRTFENAQGQPCREFVTTITIGDQEEQGYGTACRQPDGSWQLVAEAEAEETQTAPPPQVEYRPATEYYAYPSGFYGPYNIYLSFGYVYRSGHRHRGYYYLDSRAFRYRYPYRPRRHIYVGPGIFKRYRLHDELEYRDWDRRQRSHRVRQKEWKHYEREDRHRDGHRSSDRKRGWKDDDRPRKKDRDDDHRGKRGW